MSEIQTINAGEIEALLKQKPKKAKSKGASDWVIAQQVVQEYGVPLAYYGGDIWAYRKNTAWIPETMQFIAQLNKRRGRNTKNGAFEIACAQLAIPTLDQIGEPTLYWLRDGDIWDGRWSPFKVQPHQLLCSDELVDLKTGEEIPLESSIIFGPRITLPWEGPEEETPIFREMIERALPDCTIRNHFQEIVSQVIQPHVHLRGQIILYGEPHTMKSSIATAIGCAPAGTFGLSTAQEAELVRDKWASLALLNKFVNLSDDSPSHKRWVSWMKRYTAGTLLVEPKFHKPTSAVPTAKLLSTCNELPELEDASGAAGMRIIPFRFENPRKRSWERNQDEFMTASFWCRQDQRQAVLSWLIEGAMRVIDRGAYAPPAQWNVRQKRAGSDADPIASALLERLEVGENCFSPTQHILSTLPQRISSQKLAIYISRLFPNAKKEKKKSNAGRMWGYTGIKIS